MNEHITKVTRNEGKLRELYNCVSENKFASEVKVIYMSEVVKLLYRKEKSFSQGHSILLGI